MKHPVFKFAAITSLLLVTGLGGQLLFNSKPPPEEETEAVLGNARNLMIAYERWKGEAMQNGLDRKLALPLGYSKGLSAEFTQAHGQAILDLVDGVFSFEVSGLSDKDAFDVWFVDNRTGPRHSVKPEPGDGLVKLGRLDHGRGMGRLEARLDRQALKGFKLDQVVVARADKHPGEGGLLFGSPDLFQRLFYNEKGSAGGTARRRSTPA